MSKFHYEDITTDLLIRAYICGIFPMAESADSSDLFWLAPEKRGIIPLHHFHISKNMHKIMRQNHYRASHNEAFKEVIKECAKATQNRPTTWINDKIITLYEALFMQGVAHSIEIWQEEKLIGGLYGVHIGGAFFGESMFTRAQGGSKIALAHLVASLKKSDFLLLDTQFITPHLQKFGAIEITREDYETQLQKAVNEARSFQFVAEGGGVLECILQSSNHTS